MPEAEMSKDATVTYQPAQYEQGGVRTPIFALPEHEVVQALLPDITSRIKSTAEAAALVRSCPQWVPIAIDPARELIHFANLGSYRYREWQHIFTIEHLAKARLITDYFSTSTRLLDTPDLLNKARVPAGFILHVSRCGSTLFGKMLARIDDVGVINQPAVLQHGFWAWMSGNWERSEKAADIDTGRNRTRFRNLIGLLIQPRRDDESQMFIKFISWNALYVNFINACFPNTPMIYMYRNPVEVIASVLRETTAILVAKGSPQGVFLSALSTRELAQLDDVEYLSACYARCFDSVTKAGKQIHLLDYSDLKPKAMQTILATAFGIQLTQSQLQEIVVQFAVYSKDDDNQIAFSNDGVGKRDRLSAKQVAIIEKYCKPNWDRMLQSDRNIGYRDALTHQSPIHSLAEAVHQKS